MSINRRTMQTRNYILVLLVMMCYMTGSSESIFIKENEFKLFLNTTQPIWTVNTTNRYNKNFCIADVTTKLLGENVLYTHSFYVDQRMKQKVSAKMEGAFKYSNKMVATPQGSKVVFRHKLLYLDLDNFCALIKVTPKLPNRGQPWYDLRMWNASLVKYRRPSITCSHYFQLEAKHGRTVYQPICQKLLYQVNPHQQNYSRTEGTPYIQKHERVNCRAYHGSI
uniref:Putative lipocalin n=1 Tax=Rhipicephalus microplus TaxID=6941 RepID=A0A6G5A7D8_RHIMP